MSLYETSYTAPHVKALHNTRLSNYTSLTREKAKHGIRVAKKAGAVLEKM